MAGIVVWADLVVVRKGERILGVGFGFDFAPNPVLEVVFAVEIASVIRLDVPSVVGTVPGVRSPAPGGQRDRGIHQHHLPTPRHHNLLIWLQPIFCLFADGCLCCTSCSVHRQNEGSSFWSNY